jgi:hypothetical protein
LSALLSDLRLSAFICGSFFFGFSRIDGSPRIWHTPAFVREEGPEVGGSAMMRRTWAVWVVGAVSALGGCSTPEYYKAPPEQLPQPANVGGVAVQVIDQRPDWEKQPFKGSVCLYHLGKAHPDPWVQLSDETSAVVAALPQKPERVDVVVSSFQLVRSGDTAKPYRDLSTSGQSSNPGVQALGRPTGDQAQGTPASSSVPMAQRSNADGPQNKLEMMFASKDDPRRLLTDHPAGVSCSIQATVRLTYPGGNVQTVNVKTIARAPNDTDSGYYGLAIDNSARAALLDYGRQFRTAVGVTVR